MEIKFKRRLESYSYCLAFDLAKQITGWSLVDLSNYKILLSGIIDARSQDHGLIKKRYVWDFFYEKVSDVIDQCVEFLGDDADEMFVTKEQMPVQMGHQTTAETLQALAQAHAIFDLVLCHKDVDIYDFKGVHPATVKAYFRHTAQIAVPTKDDIANALNVLSPGVTDSFVTLDVSDAMAVVVTLINEKWNKDIQSEIRAAKREIKTMKSNSRREELSVYIEKLEHLQNEPKYPMYMMGIFKFKDE